MKIENGATRTVLVFKDMVVKFPTLLFTGLFKSGIKANKNELRLSGSHPDLCQVLWGSRNGLILIMKRAKQLSVNESWLDFLQYLDKKYEDDPMRKLLMSDFKPSNWGTIDGKYVKIDYGMS